MNSIHDTKVQLLHFLVKDVRMCAYIKDIKKVLPLVALEHMPRGPLYLAGLMNIHGKIIPVIDLAIRSGMTRHQPFSLDMPVLLCEKDQHCIAMIVDDVFELTNFDETKLQIHDSFDNTNSPFLGTVTDNSNSSLLINIDYFLKINLIVDVNVYADKNEN